MSTKVSESVPGQLTEKIRGLIAAQELGTGDLLPSERKLAEMLGASRGMVRNALKDLERLEMIQTIPQVGAVVKNLVPAAGAFARLLNMRAVSLQSLLEVRVSLEVTAAGLAAARATPEEIEALRAAAEAYRQAVEKGSGWERENRQFHMLLIQAARNGAILAIMENVLNDASALNDYRLPEHTRHRLGRTVDEHREILDAVSRRDPAEAERRMRFHLRRMSALAEKMGMD